MDPRYIISALAGVFAVAIIFATVTTVRHLQQPSGVTTAVVRAK
jgi:hypothetical protein